MPARLEALSLDHYIFPACEHGQIDPERSSAELANCVVQDHYSLPDGEMQDPAENCRVCKGLGVNPLAGLRFHDLRHHAITELAESQTSDSTIMALAGHVSTKDAGAL